LARESSANKVCCAFGWLKSSDVVMAGDAWPVLGEDSSAEWVDFAEGDGSHPSSLEAEAESADAAEEVEDTH
jgi:hypothetical protein